ncbi:glycosyltransferase family 2 protein [Yoonia sp.]|uniref:glycosyltransferase family 2 protein n=1 Tax=Yoonia sp. TaxID=2212373 RepID=UPI002DFAADB4|nr:glycosyltransferase family 2 protein [Yoonia sp.]
MNDDVLKQFDDLTVVSGDIDLPHTFTLTGIVHNEMHFLPAFLPHYRGLGVDRFIFIDDQSDDGTRDYLAAQADVVVLHSGWRFGDSVSTDGDGRSDLMGTKIMTIWRNLLLRKFCIDVWSLHLDADEFLDLPEGMTLQDLAAQLGTNAERAVWSVMLDMYPATARELLSMRGDAMVDFDQKWFFDGKCHLRLRKHKGPSVKYGGVRARLMQAHGVNTKANWFDRRIAARIGLPPKRYNNIRKPAFLRWAEGEWLSSPHSVGLQASTKYLLPLRHYKFNGAIAQRIQWAIETGSYASGSSEYVALEKLLTQMQQQDESFLCRNSVLYTGFEDFRRSGNAVGFD